MKPIATLVFSISLIAMLAGCRERPPEKPVKHQVKRGAFTLERSDIKDWGGDPRLRNVNVATFYWGDEPSVMVWYDGDSSWNPGYNGGDGPIMQFRGPFHSHGINGRDGYFDLEIRDAKTARFVYVGWPDPALTGGKDRDFLTGGDVLDAKDGACFLASSRTGQFKVVQLKVDMSQVTYTKEGLLALAEAEPEIKSFFAAPIGK